MDVLITHAAQTATDSVAALRNAHLLEADGKALPRNQVVHKRSCRRHRISDPFRQTRAVRALARRAPDAPAYSAAMLGWEIVSRNTARHTRYIARGPMPSPWAYARVGEGGRITLSLVPRDV